MVKNPPAYTGHIEMLVPSLGQESPLEEDTEPTPVFLPEVSHGQRSLVDYSPESCKESDTTETTLLVHTPKVQR